MIELNNLGVSIRETYDIDEETERNELELIYAIVVSIHAPVRARPYSIISL
jgi:hypothetical protein